MYVCMYVCICCLLPPFLHLLLIPKVRARPSLMRICRFVISTHPFTIPPCLLFASYTCKCSRPIYFSFFFLLFKTYVTIVYIDL